MADEEPQNEPRAFVGLYHSNRAIKPDTLAPLDKAIESIAKPHWTRAKQVAAVRSANTDAERRAAKDQLPCVTWAGTFRARTDASQDTDSGVRYVDVDAAPSDKETLTRFEAESVEKGHALREAIKEDAAAVRDLIGAQPWCYAVWLSASGMGIGMLVRCTNWQHAANAVNKVLVDNNRCFVADGCTKNLSRINYLSHDPGLHINTNACAAPATDAPPTPPRATPAPRNTPNQHHQPESLQKRLDKALTAISRLTFDGPGSNTRNYQLSVVGSLSGYVEGDQRALAAVKERLEAAGRGKEHGLWDEKWWYKNTNDTPGLFIDYCQQQGAWTTGATRTQPTGPIEPIDAGAFVSAYL